MCISYFKVAFIVSQPAQQFHRMDFPLEVLASARNKISPLSKAGFFTFAFLDIKLFCTGSHRPRSLRHSLGKTASLLNLRPKSKSWSRSPGAPDTPWNNLEPFRICDLETTYKCNPVQNITCYEPMQINL